MTQFIPNHPNPTLIHRPASSVLLVWVGAKPEQHQNHLHILTLQPSWCRKVASEQTSVHLKILEFGNQIMTLQACVADIILKRTRP